MKVEMSKKRAYKRERKLVVIEKNSVDVGFELGGIFNMMSTIREKSFAILNSHLIPILHKIKH